MSGHAEAIVTQLTGNLVPLTFQIFLLSLFPSVTLFPFCLAHLCKRTSAFKCTTLDINLTHAYSRPPFSILCCLLSYFFNPFTPMSSIFFTSYLPCVGSFPVKLHPGGGRNRWIRFNRNLSTYFGIWQSLEASRGTTNLFWMSVVKAGSLIDFSSSSVTPLLPPPAIFSGSE